MPDHMGVENQPTQPLKKGLLSRRGFLKVSWLGAVVAGVAVATGGCVERILGENVFDLAKKMCKKNGILEENCIVALNDTRNGKTILFENLTATEWAEQLVGIDKTPESTIEVKDSRVKTAQTVIGEKIAELKENESFFVVQGETDFLYLNKTYDHYLITELRTGMHLEFSQQKRPKEGTWVYLAKRTGESNENWWPAEDVMREIRGGGFKNLFGVWEKLIDRPQPAAGK